jgi:hypothetical protein
MQIQKIKKLNLKNLFSVILFIIFIVIVLGTFIFSSNFTNKEVKALSGEIGGSFKLGTFSKESRNNFNLKSVQFSDEINLKNKDTKENIELESKDLGFENKFDSDYAFKKDRLKVVSGEDYLESLGSFSKEDYRIQAEPSTSLVGFSSSSIAPGSKGIPTDQSFTVEFSQTPSSATIEALRFFPEADFEKSLSGNVLTVTPKRLDRSTTYAFGLKSVTMCKAVEGVECPVEEAWHYRFEFQSSYQDSIIYGKSVEGRDLKAYFFGNNDENGVKIMLTGAIHGEEWRSGDLSRLVRYFQDNEWEMEGRNKSFVIVPDANPDSSRIDRRYNSNGVNLNRNWPAYWEPGWNRGPYPLSEPEVKHLYDLTLEEMPDYLISYHSQWAPYGIIFPGDQSEIGTMNFCYWVSSRTGYPVGIYPYEDIVAGDQAVWAETVGIRSMIIEATCKKCTDWDKNFPMYLALIREF